MKNVLVTGAGGFIGGHLVARLRDMGVENIRGVDRVALGEWHQRFDDVDSRQGDLQDLAVCQSACEGIDTVFNLAADMGGMGFIENNKALCMLSVLISTHMLEAARADGVQRFLYSSSACVYAAGKQESPEVEPLREADAYPAMPEDGYGWEKLFSERMARHYYEDFGLETRVARYHNVYGPLGTYDGGREKAPAAICRKVAAAVLNGTTRSRSGATGARRAASPTSTTASTARCDSPRATCGSRSTSAPSSSSRSTSSSTSSRDRRRDAQAQLQPSAPQGVRGRNSDNTLINERLGWTPSISLEDGLQNTYKWIFDQMSEGATPITR